MLTKWFCLWRNFRCKFTLSITFKAIDSPEKLWSKIHPRYFTFSCCLIYVPLYTMFKALSFWILRLVLNKLIFFVLAKNVHLIYHQQTNHTNIKILLVVAFQFQLHFCPGKLSKNHLHKVTNPWQQLASHLLF